ncbi:hypothetical protein KIK06_13180 [Nocardiopsis sp. EMB25]|uniref:hypothetical protein n=1 Tax=Nocardiopsis TaxID=2013 RepID=UPI0003449DB2|nr:MULTISPECIES: hypothetical protein [Nocardiopsis]MCY9784843.1 hypothetical protein [Nocardiopsis sp. EMB25]
MSEIHGGDWWYCLKHMRVEQGAGCPNRERMGPYEDEATAARALSIAAERNEEWEAEEDR